MGATTNTASTFSDFDGLKVESMISGLAIVIVAFALLIALLPFFNGPIARIVYTAVAGSFSFWYWIPALNLFTFEYIGVGNFLITPSVFDAAVMTLGVQIFVQFGLILIRPYLYSESLVLSSDETEWAYLGLMAFGLAFLSLALRFASNGFGVITQLASGLLSARELQSYANLSSGADQSLGALVEIVAIAIGLLAMARHAFSRSLFTGDGMLAILALVMMFAASGTRAVLLQSLVVFWLVSMVRPRQRLSRQSFNPVRMLILGVGIVALLAVVSTTFIARFAADSGYARAGSFAAVIDTLVVNNDMMRELSFSIDTMQPDSSGAVDFVLTPISYMMPRFLGFEKEIPYHLIQFNFVRIGSDLNIAEGNVFPGLVADFWLNFGYWGGFMLSFFVTIFTLFVVSLSRLAGSPMNRVSFIAVSFGFLFFCFRNITGALGIVIVLLSSAVIVLRFLARRNASRMARDTDMFAINHSG